MSRTSAGGLVVPAVFFHACHAPASSAAANEPSGSYLPKRAVRIVGIPLGLGRSFIVCSRLCPCRPSSPGAQVLCHRSRLVRGHARLRLAVESNERFAVALT